MPDLGHVVEEFQAFHWKLQNWKELDKTLRSPEFDCGGHKWRILLFPSGNCTADVVSLYLDRVTTIDEKEAWHVCAQFALVISNPYDPTLYTVSHARHRFTAEESDWGFTRFSELNKLEHPQPGLSRPTIEGGSAIVSVYVRVLEDPAGVLWHNFVDFDSRKETGFVGLKNLGATSYLNSLLQSLFCIRYFRKAVYQIPTEVERPTESIPLALQRLFYCLQTSGQPVGTAELTTSFGWNSTESFLPHDVQEFNRVLQDSLESRMKGTRAEGAIAKLFSGKMKSFIKCVNVDYESSRIEEFRDIQLNVKGMKTLYDAFRDYVAVEMMDGENMYQAEGFGLQEARKGIIFQSLPPVLHLQLKRYEYDIQRDAMVKINDRFEFPSEIDLDEFLDETADRHKSWKYKLHGVIVHSGTAECGKCIALIKPDQDGLWLKFDDDRVTPVVGQEVLEGNYGREPLDVVVPPTQGNGDTVTNPFGTNAYVLVYIRETEIYEVLAPLTEEDTPPHLKQRLDEERVQIETKKKEREEQNLFLTVKVVTDRTFARHEGFDLALFDERGWPVSDLPTFRVLKREMYSTFKLWVMVNRQNRTVRPDACIPEDDPSLTIETLRENMDPRQQTELRLCLDFLPGPSTDMQSDNAGGVMIFLKHFDTTKQTIYGVGKIHVQRTCKVRNLIPIINKRMRWALGTSLKLYEEIKPGMIEPMRLAYTLAQSEIQNGDIICFQVEISPEQIHRLESQGFYSSPLQLYDFLQNRVTILFRPKFDADCPEFSLVFSKKQNYDAMASKVGEQLKHEMIKLRFTTTYGSSRVPKSVLKRSLNQSIEKMTSLPHFPSSRIVILYEKLHVSIIKLETKRTLKVVWTGAHNKEELTHLFLSSTDSSVHDVIEHLSKRVQLTPSGTGRIRVFEVAQDERTRREFTGFEMIGDIVGPDPVELFAEEIPREELEVGANGKIINVFHFTWGVTRTHGIPFKFVLKPGERLSEMKKRIQQRLDVSEKDFPRFRFALVRTATPCQVSYLEDDDIIPEREFALEDYLGLNHVDKSGKARNIARGIRFGVVKDVQEPVELFAEEIPREDSEAGDQENLTNVFRLTRDVARTHGIAFKFAYPPPRGLEYRVR
ncbi:cysteine proteinase [Thelephora terrestris]|uniref:ubiquitinyl hydrolase 1 n=1 Tax=Thelephora terrestris TaxID=56493 RepID=A0A9P6H660_9AGAM|nr:cysteine proteinase [Thelephora terrestris]